MPEADVLYSDVKFTRVKGYVNASSSAETTYAEVRISKTRPSTELPGSQQQALSNGGSKVTPERVALVVLSALLAAAVVALGFTSYKNIQTMERLQKLTDEHEAVKKNLTARLTVSERPCEVKSCNTVQPTCPQPTAGKINEQCLKCEEGWEHHGGKCYYFSTDRLTWNKSRDECRRGSGDLVKIDSREEQIFLELKLREKMNHTEDKFWIGLTDSKKEGTWLWADGSPLDTSLSFWNNKEPDNWTTEDPDGEDCVRMGEKGGADDLKCWLDKSCKVLHRRICEKTTEIGRVECV